jgi:hypothetical protein
VAKAYPHGTRALTLITTSVGEDRNELAASLDARPSTRPDDEARLSRVAAESSR